MACEVQIKEDKRSCIQFDIYPTLLGITGTTVKNQPRLDGVDLTEIISGAKTKRPAMGFGTSSPMDKAL